MDRNGSSPILSQMGGAESDYQPPDVHQNQQGPVHFGGFPDSRLSGPAYARQPAPEGAFGGTSLRHVYRPPPQAPSLTNPLAEEPDAKRMRFSTSHPEDTTRLPTGAVYQPVLQEQSGHQQERVMDNEANLPAAPVGSRLGYLAMALSRPSLKARFPVTIFRDGSAMQSWSPLAPRNDGQDDLGTRYAQFGQQQMSQMAQMREQGNGLPGLTSAPQYMPKMAQRTHSDATGTLQPYGGSTGRREPFPLPNQGSIYKGPGFVRVNKIDSIDFSDDSMKPQSRSRPRSPPIHSTQRMRRSKESTDKQGAPPRFSLSEAPSGYRLQAFSAQAAPSQPVPAAAEATGGALFRYEAAQAIALLHSSTAPAPTRPSEDDAPDFATVNPLTQAPAVAPPQMPAGGPTTTTRGSNSLQIVQIANGANRIAGYNPELTTAADVKTRLPACEIGAVELLTFFPHHTLWPRVILRLVGGGWRSSDISKVRLHARNAITSPILVRHNGAVRRQVIEGGNHEFGVRNFTQDTYRGQLTNPQRPGGVGSYDASIYHPRPQHTNSLRPAKLVAVARDVVNWPAAEDSGIVTQVIDLAVQNNYTELTTDDIPQVAQHFGFVMPTEAAGADWDTHGCRRAMAAIAEAGPYA